MPYLFSKTEDWLRSGNKNKRAYFVLRSACTIFACDFKCIWIC